MKKLYLKIFAAMIVFGIVSNIYLAVFNVPDLTIHHRIHVLIWIGYGLVCGILGTKNKII